MGIDDTGTRTRAEARAEAGKSKGATMATTRRSPVEGDEMGGKEWAMRLVQ